MLIRKCDAGFAVQQSSLNFIENFM